MSHAIDSDSGEELVFYVDEEGDDFTFYLKQDKAQTVFNALKKSKSQRSGGTDDESSSVEAFSFPEQVLIKNLGLTKDSLTPTEEFWKHLKAVSPNTQHLYLVEKLEVKDESELIREISTKDEKIFLERIAKILNDIVAGESCENEVWAKIDLPERDRNFLDKLTNEEKKKKWKNRLILEQAFPDLIRAQKGRGLICSSYRSKYLSVTFRKISGALGYEAKKYEPVDTEKRQGHLFSLGEYSDLLYEEVFEPTGSNFHAQGLLVITGATKSAKSEIARGLIHKYLEGKTDKQRKPHLVTFEDPVERLFADHTDDDHFAWAAIDPPGKDYTPREKDKDAGLLRDALNDALRQTPTVFFVGETRHREEWKVLLDFAGTGHLILTTAHAGSLVEAMHKIFEALRVKTPADRSEIANKLLGVIHLRSSDLDFTKPSANSKKVERASTNVLFPALWRRTPLGIAALTSDGLASLLPYRPRPPQTKKNTPEKSDDSDGDDPSCLGRRSLIEKTFLKAGKGAFKVFPDNAEKLKKDAFDKAIEWDLQGV